MSSFGKVGQVLLPSQQGARRWADEYGERLVRVRYRYDPDARLRFTTVEHVVESHPWQPAATDTALVQVDFEEHELRERIKACGGCWEPALKRWRVPRRLVTELQLEKRLDPRPPPS